MTLYDWLLEWVTPPTEKKKQINIKNYILKNFTLLSSKESRGLINKDHWFIKNHNKEEDIFTYLRNDIGHSYEKIEDDNISSLSTRAKTLIIPLVYVMKTYLKNS